MKKRLFLISLLCCLLLVALAIGVSAAGSESNEYGAVTKIDGVDEPTVIDTTSRVVLKASDGSFYTFPAYYILADRTEFTWKINDKVNEILGINESNALNMKNYTVRMEIPEGIVTVNKEDRGGAYAFERSTSLVEFTWPSTLNYIGNYSFGQCSKLANIVNFEKYFPNITYLGSQAFYSNIWGTGMELVIPKGITSLSDRCFQGTKIFKAIVHSGVTVMKNHVFASCSNLTEIVFEGGCQLTEIGNYCFEYTKLTSFDFTQFADSLSKLGDGVFNTCTNLTTVTGFGLLNNPGITAVGPLMFSKCPLTNIELPPNITSIGTQAFYLHRSEQSELRIPNGVKTIGKHAFAKPIEVQGGAAGLKIYLPAGLETISGEYNMEYWHFTEMYIPSGIKIPTGFIHGTKTSGVTYYYTGDINTLEIDSVNNKAILGAEWVTLEQYNNIADKSTKNYIVYNYNQCDAFYKGNHKNVQSNPCVNICSVCNIKTVNHISDYETVIVEYVNGFMAQGERACICTNEGCTFKISEKLEPLFTCLGYSAYEGDKGGITIGFTTNIKAITDYSEVTGKTVKYGVFTALEKTLGNEDIFTKDGEAISGVINAEITNYQFAVFELKMVGFTDALKDVRLAMGAYVAVTEEDTTEYSYLQSGTPSENEKYCFISYNDVVKNSSSDTVQ